MSCLGESNGRSPLGLGLRNLLIYFVYIHVYFLFTLYISIFIMYLFIVSICGRGGGQEDEAEPRGDANSATCSLSRCAGGRRECRETGGNLLF